MKSSHLISKKNVFLFVLIVALLFAAFFYKSTVVYFVKSSVFKISSPLMEKLSGLYGFFNIGYFSSKKSLLGENQRIEEENRELLMRLGNLKILERENEELKKLLAIKEIKPGFDYIQVRSLGLIRDGRDEYIFISGGVENGIHSDLLVMDAKGTLVGRVAEANQQHSKVKLATSVSETQGGILPAAGIRVLVKGNGFREFLVDLIPEDTPVNIGDEILVAESIEYAGLSLVLGRVVEVGTSGSQIFKNVKALHSFDPWLLEPIYVVKKP